jgi:isoamylase
MLQAGDEIGRTQEGNNNAYCQDNDVSWLDWSLDDEKRELAEFVRRLVAIRRAHPVFRRRDFFQGRPLHGSGVKDVVWLKPDGTEMTDAEWEHDFARALGVFLAGDALSETDARGRPLSDDSFLVLFNAHHDEIAFRLPSYGARRWFMLIDTAREGADGNGERADIVHEPGAGFALQGRSLALFVQKKAAG